MKLGRRLFSLFVIAACLTFIISLTFQAAYTVQAHANLMRSEPESGAVLDLAPQMVVLEFSEALDPDLSKAKLADSDLTVLVNGPGRIDPDDNRVLKLNLPVLGYGAYNVIWQARSAVDGHITNGVVTFSIGKTGSNVSLLPLPGAPDATNTRPPGIDTLLRWFSYLAAALLAGSTLFGWLVWDSAYQAWDGPDPLQNRYATNLLRRLALVGITGLAACSAGLSFVQAWEAINGAFQIPFTQALIALLNPQNGWIFWLRLALLGLLAYLLNLRRRKGDDAASSSWQTVVVSVAILLTFSLQSHAAAAENPIAVAMDWFHITAMSTWLGGLLPLFLLLRKTELPPKVLVPKFSRLALTCVAILAISGSYAALIQVQSFQALITTIFGKALAAKSILFAVLIGLGAVNLLLLSPRLEKVRDVASRHLRTSIRVEIGLGLLVLALVGLMTGVSPSYEAVQARQRAGFVGEYQENGTRMDLWIAPDRVGENEFAIDVQGKPPGISDYQPQVLLRLELLDVSLGLNQVEAVHSSGNRYTVRGSYLTIAGNWQVEVILRQSGVNDIRNNFLIQVQSNPYSTNLKNPIPATANSLAAGKSLYEQNCLPCHGPQGKGDGPAGLALHPPPADLSIHTAPGVHPDGQLFEWITNGYPGSAMPAFGKQLSEIERWELVSFIRTLVVK